MPVVTHLPAMHWTYIASFVVASALWERWVCGLFCDAAAAVTYIYGSDVTLRSSTAVTRTIQLGHHQLLRQLLFERGSDKDPSEVLGALLSATGGNKQASEGCKDGTQQSPCGYTSPWDQHLTDAELDRVLSQSLWCGDPIRNAVPAPTAR
jgi:hypothetical protein